MIAVADVQQASRWYQQVLGATSGHGGPEYEQLMVGGELDAQIVTDVHLNPNAGHHEIWIRDLDGYLVVFAEPPG
jgi:catechol 2,3-dioxygenase-like lactoylglutathione lyase family enzyme